MVWQVFVLLQHLVQHSSFLQLFFTGEVIERFGKVQWCGNGIKLFDSSSFESLRFNGCWWETWQFNMVSDCRLSSGQTPGTWSLSKWGCPFRVAHARQWAAPGVQLVRPRPRLKWWDNMSGVLSLLPTEFLQNDNLRNDNCCVNQKSIVHSSWLVGLTQVWSSVENVDAMELIFEFTSYPYENQQKSLTNNDSGKGVHL